MKRFVCKLASEQLPVGRYMEALKYWKADACPRCLCPNETALHVLSCQDTRATTLRDQLIQDFIDELQRSNTAPDLIQSAQTLLRKATQQGHTAVQETVVLQNQAAFSDLQFMQGRLTYHWRLRQKEYYEAIQSPRSASKWAADFLTALWKIAFQLWDQRNTILHSNQSIKDQLNDLNDTNANI